VEQTLIYSAITGSLIVSVLVSFQFSVLLVGIVGSLRFTDSFLPVQVCGYFIYTQAIGSRKGLRPWPPRRAINLDCISVHLLSSRCASRFPRTPRQTDRRLSSAKTFLWVFMLLWSSFFGFWLAAIYKFTCCMPLALFWLPVSDRTF